MTPPSEPNLHPPIHPHAMNAYRSRNDLPLTRKVKARMGRLLLSLSPETADAVHRRPYSKE